MSKPFLKWAGGKRWLAERSDFQLPRFTGRYIEPFMGGAAIFFHLSPPTAILSDVNSRLVETYIAIRDNWSDVVKHLTEHQFHHSKQYYYQQRSSHYQLLEERAAQFLYLNRACWNGLYRENLKGQFNVPIGTKEKILLSDDDFAATSSALQYADIRCCDFSDTIQCAQEGDLLFVDPPYTTAHNNNGFVKYNQKIFSWEDQVRLRDELLMAQSKGAKIILTNAQHESLVELYAPYGKMKTVPRASVISGANVGRGTTEEMLVYL